MQPQFVLNLFCLSLCLAAHPLRALDLTGAGSTFAFPVVSRWADTHFKISGHKVNYQSIGSGGGIKQIEKGLVDFGATDMALGEDELRQKSLYQFPLVRGEIVAIVQLTALGASALHLDGPTLANIFRGQIKNWNDEAIKRLNPKLDLPDLGITVVHRADGSGTTYNWTKFMGEVSAEWRTSIGISTAVRWPTGVGGKGNEGVAAFVKRIEGAIGYVEIAFVKAAKLKRVDLDQPVVATTYVLLPRVFKDPAHGLETLRFFRRAFGDDGAAAARALEYRPLDRGESKRVEDNWRKLWPAMTASL